MENASKALIIAGSMIITGAIVAIILSLYTYLRNANASEVNTKEISQIVELNKKIEDYNKDLVYGTDILSLINLIEDYNIQESKLNGYEEIKMTITIRAATTNFPRGNYRMSNFLTYYNRLQEKINKATNDNEYNKLVQERNTIKTKQFKCTSVTYSGERITNITFAEK